MARNINVAIVLAVLGVIGAGIIVAATTRFGAGMTPDSVGYVATARHLAAGDGAFDFDERPLVVQPPLYPAVLAAIDRVFGVDAVSSAHILNAALFGLMIFLGGLLAWTRLAPYRAATIGVALLILLSAPTIDIAVRALSEPLFICLVLLSLMGAHWYRVSNTMPSLVALALFVALSAVTRYIGVTLILWGALVVLIWDRHRFRVRLLRVATFVVIAAAPLAIWLTRNYALSGTFFGDRTSSTFPFTENVGLVATTVLSWYAPGRLGLFGEIVVAVGFMIVGIFYMWPRREHRNRPASQYIAPEMLLVVVYTAFLVISSTTTAYDQIGDRLLLPLHIPITVLLAIPTAEVIRRWLITRRRTLVLAVVATACVGYEVRSTALEVQKVHVYGRGYSSTAWVNSPTVRYIRQHRTLESACPFYSNAPELAYLWSGRAPKLAPMKNEPNSREVINDLASLKGAWPEEPEACLLWFEDVERQFLFSVADLQAIANVRLVTRFHDGAIYVIARD